MLKLSRPLVFLDTETTGLEPQKDRIITLALETHRESLSVNPTVKEWKMNPCVPIPAEVTAVHGITDAMVAKWPTFKECRQEIITALVGCDYGGFNTTFDLQMLAEEFGRCDISFDLTRAQIIDVGMIYKKRYPRTLEAAVEQYLDRKHEGAHGASADTIATREVLEAMLKLHEPLAELDLPALAHYSLCNDRDGSIRADLAGTILKRKDGVLVYGTKRNRGVPVDQDPGYAAWILRSDFPENTKDVVRMALKRSGGNVDLL